MKKLQCDLCRGTLLMDDSGERATCEYCGMKYMRETVEKMLVKLDGEVQVEGIASIDSLLVRANQLRETGDFDKAKEYYDRVLELNPECAKSHFGYFLAEGHAKNPDEWQIPSQYYDPSDKFRSYFLAKECADEKELVGEFATIQNKLSVISNWDFDTVFNSYSVVITEWSSEMSEKCLQQDTGQTVIRGTPFLSEAITAVSKIEQLGGKAKIIGS